MGGRAGGGEERRKIKHLHRRHNRTRFCKHSRYACVRIVRETSRRNICFSPREIAGDIFETGLMLVTGSPTAGLFLLPAVLPSERVRRETRMHEAAILTSRYRRQADSAGVESKMLAFCRETSVPKARGIRIQVGFSTNSYDRESVEANCCEIARAISNSAHASRRFEASKSICLQVKSVL